MFRAVGRNYRDLVRAADRLAPMERTREIARIFSYFRNPDKETVLTPWRVLPIFEINDKQKSTESLRRIYKKVSCLFIISKNQIKNESHLVRLSFKLAPPVGLEPTTYRLTVECSTG